MNNDFVQQTLREEDIQKASSLFEVPVQQFQKFNDMNMLNVPYIRSLLMRADYERLTSGLQYLSRHNSHYRYPEAIKAIAKHYNIGPKAAAAIINGTDERMFFCSKCGIRVSSQMYKRLGGLCPNCHADTLEL